MTDLLTQCPRCGTRFRLDRSQLEAARGIVRCGHCRALFRAEQPVTEPAQAEPTELRSDQAAAADSVQDAEPNPWTYRGVDLDSLELHTEPASPDRQTADPASELLNAAPGAEQSAAVGAETQEPALRFSPVTREHPLPPSPLSADSRPIRGVLARQHADGRIEPAIGLVDPRLDEPLRAEASLGQPAEPAAAPFDVEDEPLHLEWQPRRKPWGRWLAWSLLILLALLALVGQYGYYNLDELARQERYRPWLERICPLVGCTLPSRVDIQQIRSSNLVVRSHPDFNGALVVDAIIYNRAPFAQPFPLLEFSFADINGDTIASRRFKPGEYLSGELAGQQEMPSQIPIHISLDILDPGARAVNYSLGFRSPD